jgi:hypothetical protein
MDLKEIECEGANWIHLAQESFQWEGIEYSTGTSDSIKGMEFLDQLIGVTVSYIVTFILHGVR